MGYINSGMLTTYSTPDKAINMAKVPDWTEGQEAYLESLVSGAAKAADIARMNELYSPAAAQAYFSGYINPMITENAAKAKQTVKGNYGMNWGSTLPTQQAYVDTQAEKYRTMALQDVLYKQEQARNAAIANIINTYAQLVPSVLNARSNWMGYTSPVSYGGGSSSGGSSQGFNIGAGDSYNPFSGDDYWYGNTTQTGTGKKATNQLGVNLSGGLQNTQYDPETRTFYTPRDANNYIDITGNASNDWYEAEGW